MQLLRHQLHRFQYRAFVSKAGGVFPTSKSTCSRLICIIAVGDWSGSLVVSVVVVVRPPSNVLTSDDQLSRRFSTSASPVCWLNRRADTEVIGRVGQAHMAAFQKIVIQTIQAVEFSAATG